MALEKYRARSLYDKIYDLTNEKIKEKIQEIKKVEPKGTNKKTKKTHE
jgi:hypothetical protein